MTGIYEGVEKRNERGITVKGHCARETVEKFARNDVIKLSYQVDVAEEGWIENLKRIHQVLWKKGWIDDTLPQHRHFALHSLVSERANFQRREVDHGSPY